MSARRVNGTEWHGARMVCAAGLALLIGMVGIMAIESTPAQAKFKQPACAKFKKKQRKAKSKSARQRFAARFRHCKANRRVYRRVRNSQFVGAQGDGDPVNMVFCANGKLIDDYGTPSQRIYRKGWRIVDARIKGRNFNAGFEALLKVTRTQVSMRSGYIGKRKGRWQIGGGDATSPFNPGAVKRRKAAGICRKI